MPSVTTRSDSSIPIPNPNPTIPKTPNVSDYEKCREDRIKENMQRMQNLGILDLSLKLKSETRPVKRQYTTSRSPRTTPPQTLQISVSTRRSSRLKDVTPVTYREEKEKKKGKRSREVGFLLEGGVKPEVYTEEHEKLLGNTERTWELFVDGFGKDGKRIYDPVNGKTCHQCRQKTMGHRTQCSKCYPAVTGQFCGDCLYMRYGEHVLEALENPEWTCPGCRGICNCSICRNQKGWNPTGNAYRKVTELGYKSVAHYLVLTNKKSETSEEEEAEDSPSKGSAKRSLAFKEGKESSEEEADLPLMITDGREDNQADDDEGTNKNPDSARKSLTFSSSVENPTPVTDDVHAQNDLEPADVENQTSVTDDVNVQGDLKPADVENQTPVTDEPKPLAVVEMEPATPPVVVDIDAHFANKENGETKRSKRKCSVEPNPNSIGARLRQRRRSQA